jgi:hypothetical protein
MDIMVIDWGIDKEQKIIFYTIRSYLKYIIVYISHKF